MAKFATVATIKTVPGKREEYLKHMKDENFRSENPSFGKPYPDAVCKLNRRDELFADGTFYQCKMPPSI